MNRNDILKLPSMPASGPSYPAGPYRFIDREFMVISYETDPEVVEVFVNGTQLPCSRLARGIQFTAKGPGKEAMTVEARSSIREPSLQAIQSRKYRLKVSARRYLSEVRDNYLCRFPRLTERAASVQQLLHRVR